MENLIPIPFIEVEPIDGLPEKTSLEPGGHMLYQAEDGKEYRISTDTFYQILHSIAKPISPTDAGPFIANSWYKPTTSSVDPGTNYPNAGSLKARVGYDTLFWYDGTNWIKTEVGLPKADDSVKVTFTSVVKFDQKKKYSTINQAGTINFTYDPSGVTKEAIDKRYIVSDGVSDINFSSSFDVIGEIDKTKNQEIYFTRPELVEFKIPAVIVNVAKSGQVTPVDLDPDAQIYYDKILAAGATLSTAETNAMNNFYLAAKANGYFSKLKGLYFVLGSNAAAKLLNGISGRPDATLASGTITADGIGGVLDSGMKPSDIFSLTSFSYGLHNTTAIYSNIRSMGCGVSATSGITFLITGTSPSGQSLISGPNRDVFGQIANADSLGAYVVSRTGGTTAKLYKNGSAILTHSASQGSATLPNINFAIGGYNDNGTIADDTRTTKWAFLADGLSDSEAAAITTDFNTLMSAIGR
ncbi:hypothetical protein [Chryseobacterium sp. 2VB]|uniref:hypothetical protein n=1 Tax=Chryseobacterium sp. 2VB TaxID=2502204 RepID=UPI0010F7A424|nr:hypothetical protein [Chryseobacterium sp. 2VB]